MQNDSINIFKKISINFAADRDAKSVYGRELAEWNALCTEMRKKDELIDPQKFPVSGYMGREVMKYQREHARAIKLFRKRSKCVYVTIQKKYFQYIEFVNQYRSAMEAIQRDIDNISSNIEWIKSQKKTKENYYQKARSDDIVTLEMGAGNLRELYEQIEEYKRELSDLEKKLEVKEDEYNTCNKLYQEQLEKSAIPIDLWTKKYEYRINTLRDTIKSVLCKYDEELACYLYEVGRRKNINVGGSPVSVIYGLCGVYVDDIDTNFSQELAFIKLVKYHLSLKGEDIIDYERDAAN